MINRSLAFVLLLAFTSCAYAAGEQTSPQPMQSCQTQVPFGWPQASRPGTTPVCRQAYVLLHDNIAKVSLWEAYTLTPQHAVGCLARVNAFAPDQSLPRGQRSELADYAKSGYDTGHIANDADMSWDPTVQRESFILSNMAPQLPSLNRGIWKELETYVRDWAYTSGHSLTIYAGSIYDVSSDRKIGPDSVVVPHAFYKIVIDDTTRQSLAFIFPHRDGLGTDLRPLQTTVASVESQTGISFPVPDSKTAVNAIWPVNLAPLEAAKKQCSR